MNKINLSNLRNYCSIRKISDKLNINYEDVFDNIWNQIPITNIHLRQLILEYWSSWLLFPLLYFPDFVKSNYNDIIEYLSEEYDMKCNLEDIPSIENQNIVSDDIDTIEILCELHSDSLVNNYHGLSIIGSLTKSLEIPVNIHYKLELNKKIHKLNVKNTINCVNVISDCRQSSDFNYRYKKRNRKIIIEVID